jgi:energy-coupling factor transporter ATP-binding protein EcfA2
VVKISNLMNHLGKAVPESASAACNAEQTPFFDWATEDFAVALLCGGKGLSPQEPAPSAENPFTPLNGRIGDPAMVFGRESKVNEALELLRRGSSVVFLGDHGSGKSSLLTLLIERVSKDLGWKIAHLDLLLVEDEDSFYRELCLALGVPEARGYPLKRSLTGKRFLLALDEMERMASQGFTRNIRDQLRGLADGPSEPLKLAMAASTSLDRLFPDSEEAKISPLAGICQQIQVGPWDIATAREFLLERLETTSVTFSEAEIGQIFKESMGMPRELMHKAFHLYRRKIEQEP